MSGRDGVDGGLPGEEKGRSAKLAGSGDSGAPPWFGLVAWTPPISGPQLRNGNARKYNMQGAFKRAPHSRTERALV